MTKRSLQRLTLDCWSPDPVVRVEAMRVLGTMASAEMADIRQVFPVLVWSLGDSNAEVRHAALATLEGCAAMGRDVGIAVPMCVELTQDERADMRLLAWSVLGAAHRRRPIFQDLERVVAAGRRDPDERVAERAASLTSGAATSGR